MSNLQTHSYHYQKIAYLTLLLAKAHARLSHEFIMQSSTKSLLRYPTRYTECLYERTRLMFHEDIQMREPYKSTNEMQHFFL